MSSHSRRKHPIRWLYRLVAAVLFCFLAAVLIAGANGYQYDFEAGRFQSTGVIGLTVQQVPVKVTLNSKEYVVTDKVSKYANLIPGYYSIKIEKEGYYPWVKNQYLNAGQAIAHPFIRMFLAHPTVVPATQAEELAFVNETAQPSIFDDMDVRGNEIWVKPVTATYPIRTVSDTFVLIGRYSANVTSAVWYPGRTNIIMQIGNEIRVIDRDGSNDSLLATLSSSDASLFYISNDGKSLFYQDDGAILRRPLVD